MYNIEHEWCGDTPWKVVCISEDKKRLVGRCKDRLEANQLIARDQTFRKRDGEDAN